MNNQNMSDKLAQICAAKRSHIAERKAKMPEAELRKKLADIEPPRGFRRVLKEKLKAGEFGLIAEIKKASPSKGVIRADFDPVSLAQAYVEGGAACLSVLTDVPYFQGHDDYLPQVRKAVPLPLLRKDFMLDPYQLVESRVLGADCILLIMAALEDKQASELEALAFDLGMDVLIEVHNEDEMKRVLANLKSRLIGINNRNLKTLEVDLSTSEKLAKFIPLQGVGVCESGIESHEDLMRMRQSGLRCFLVGESLMRQPDVRLATARLLGSAA